MFDAKDSNTIFIEEIKNDGKIVENQSEPSFESKFQKWKNIQLRHQSHYSSPVLNSNISTVIEEDEHVDYFDSDSDVEPSGIVVKSDKMIVPPISQFSAKPSTLPNIGVINIQNAQNTIIGDKTIYNGPVSIQRILNVGADDESKENSTKADCANRRENGSPFKMNGFRKLLMRWNFMSERMKFAIGAFIVLSVLLAIVLTIIFATRDNGEDAESSTPPPPSGLRIVSRKMWNAIPPKYDLDKLTLPATRVIIIHTATQNCTEESVCISKVQAIQRNHIEEKGFAEIGYNFLIGGHGSVYEGRGWNIQGAHTRDYNQKSIAIAFIGTFDTELPPDKQLDAAQKLMDYGVQLKRLEILYNLYGQCQLMSTESPGKALYELIQKWDHYSRRIE